MPFFRGVNNGIFRTLKCTFRVSVLRGYVAGRGLQHLEAFCLKLSFFAYNCLGSLLLTIGAFLLTIGACALTIEILFLRGGICVHIDGLYAKKLNCRQKSSNCN